MGVLLDIKGDLGELKGKFDTHAGAFAAHCVADDLRESAKVEAIRRLELVNARQRGFVAAISAVGAIVGAGLGALADYLSRGGNH